MSVLLNLSRVPNSNLKFSASFGQSEHFHKRIITLDDCGINCAGPVGEIASMCPNVEELDLAKNDLSDFHEVRYM